MSRVWLCFKTRTRFGCFGLGHYAHQIGDPTTFEIIKLAKVACVRRRGGKRKRKKKRLGTAVTAMGLNSTNDATEAKAQDNIPPPLFFLLTTFLCDEFCSCWAVYVVSVCIIFTATHVCWLSTIHIAPAALRCNVPFVGGVVLSRGPGSFPCRCTVFAHKSVVRLVPAVPPLPACNCSASG